MKLEALEVQDTPLCVPHRNMGSRIEVTVIPHRNDMRRRLRPRPGKVLTLMHDEMQFSDQ